MDSRELKVCFKPPLKVLDKLNVIISCNNIGLWNKYQLILYENGDFNRSPLIFTPDFVVYNVILYKNYILCLDCGGSIHISSTKNAKQIENNINFRPKADNIVAIVQLNNDNILIIQEKIEKIYNLSVLKTVNFEQYPITDTNFDTDIPAYKIKEKSILKSYTISNSNKDKFKDIFKNLPYTLVEGYFLLYTIDGRNLCGGLLNMNKCKLDTFNLHSCPSDICDFGLIERNTMAIIIGLKSGSLIELKYENEPSTRITHLNAALYKMLITNNDIFYTDGISMWKIDTNINYEIINYNKLFIKHAKDFLKYNDRLICTTFADTVYVIPYENESLYITEKPTTQYHPINPVIDSAEELLKDISLEIQRNNEIVKKIVQEDIYTTLIALANRPDILGKALQYGLTVYDNYEDVIKDNTNIILTSDLKEYFENNVFQFLINFQFLMAYDYKFKDVFSNVKGRVKLQCSVASQNVALKTLSITINEVLGSSVFLIPFKLTLTDITELTVNLKLICSIPGPKEESQVNWLILSTKTFVLTSEHFIKVYKGVDSKIKTLRAHKKDLKELIINTSNFYHGSLYSLSNKNIASKEMLYSVKLAENYETILTNIHMYKTLNKTKAEFLSKKLGTKEFMKLFQIIQIYVLDYRVNLQLVKNDDGDTLLHISCCNPNIAFDLRQYFSEIINAQKTRDSLLIPQAQYTLLEDLRRKLNTHVCGKNPNFEFILSTQQEFNEVAIGNL